MYSSLNHQIEKMYNKRDPRYVSKFDKLMGIISLVGALAAFVLALIGFFTGGNTALLLFAIFFS